MFKERLDFDGNPIDEKKEVQLSALVKKEEGEKKKMDVPMIRPDCPSCYGAGLFFSFIFVVVAVLFVKKNQYLLPL